MTKFSNSNNYCGSLFKTPCPPPSNIVIRWHSASKLRLKKFASRHGVKIQQYHVDNSQFADNAFIKHCEDNRQHISLAVSMLTSKMALHNLQFATYRNRPRSNYSMPKGCDQKQFTLHFGHIHCRILYTRTTTCPFKMTASHTLESFLESTLAQD